MAKNEHVPRFYEFGAFRLDAEKRLLWHDDDSVPLMPKAFDVLLALLRRHGQVVTKDELMASVWRDTVVEENSLNVNVSALRKVFGEKPHEHRFIVTVPGVGYKFVADVREGSGDAREVILQENAAGDTVAQKVERSIAVEEHRDGEVNTKTDFASAQPGSSVLKNPPEPLKYFSLKTLVGFGVAVALLAAFFVWKWRQEKIQTVKILRSSQITTWTSLDIYPAFSPDGNSIAYTSDHGGNFEIYIKPLAPGANEIQLTSDGQQNFQPAFSPDGKFIAYYSKYRGGIWVVPASGGKVKQITTFGSRPVWSPDGSSIAFQSNPIVDLGASALPALPPSTIWIIPSQGGEPTQLTHMGNPAGGHGSPAWSPDGKRIVFCASDALESSAWTMSSKGGDVKQVSKGYVVDAVYAPDGEGIYYGSNYGLWKIRVSRASGEPVGEPVELANTSPARLRHFTLSTDGKKISYAALSISSNIRSVPISTALNEAAGESVSLTQNRSFRNTLPSFSPDGRKIAYQSFNVGGAIDIWLMDADGKNATQVTTEGGSCPSWFPDGEQIAFASNRQGRWQAWVANLKTGQDQPLLDFGEENVQYMWMSPDGKQIAFNSKKSGTINIAVIPIEGGEAKQLTFDKESMGFVSWSPNGKTLAFNFKRGDDAHMAIMPSDGGEITQLTFDKGLSWSGGFSPDGDKIAFAGFRHGVWNVWWVSRSTKQQKQLTNYTKLNSYVRYPTWSPLNNKIAYEYAETTGNIWMLELK